MAEQVKRQKSLPETEPEWEHEPESEQIDVEIGPDYEELPVPVNVADWLETDPPEPDQVLTDTFDVGDKVAIIASSKLKKTFFLLQMLIYIAAGRPFLNWQIPLSRRILHVQFEIQDQHYHRRVKRMAKAMGITSTDLGDRFHVLNAEA